MKTIKILIAEDHQVTREGIKRVLFLQKDFTPVVDEAKNGIEAVSLCRHSVYDVIIMDIHMPGKDGIEATKAIIKRHKKARIIAFSMYDEKNFIHSMIKAGAVGYILKNAGVEEIIKAVQTVASGQRYFCNEVSLTLMEPFFDEIISADEETIKRTRNLLSEREKEILKILVYHGNSHLVSEELNISKRTVENHKYRIMEKLNVKGTSELISFAIKNRLV